MRAPSLKDLPALLVPTAAAWVLAAQGAGPSPWVAVLTVAVAAALLLQNLDAAFRPTAPVAWAAGLVAWVAADAALRPVAAFGATRAVAAALAALALAASAGTPRTASWGRLAVVCSGTCAAVWMAVERALHAGRPAGPFGNPNGAATLILLGLALTPFLRVAIAVRAALLAVGVAGILASGSRGALLGALAVAVVWGLKGRRNRGLAVGAGLVAAAGVLGLGIRLAVDRDPLRYERFRIWGVAFKVAAAELPLGCGPGGYGDVAIAHNFPRDGEFARFARLPDLAESDFLQAAASLGLPGVALTAGLLISVALQLRGRGAAPWGVAVALAATSAVNSQVVFPAVLWTGSLALGSVQRRRNGGGRAGPRAGLVVAVVALAAISAAILALPDWGLGPSAESLVGRAEAALRSRPPSDDSLADAEALTRLACSARPRFARAWRLLGNIRLRRATLRDEAGLAAAAVDAFAEARRVNPLDPWGALGEATARRALGDRPGAMRALGTAVLLEPNCAPAWLELATLRLAQGEVEQAHEALRRAEAATRRASGATFVTDYERELARLDSATVSRLRAALGEGP
ncbi:MAG: O-antigen ligase family protein [Acidobacteriia bacterium]|nr:O-antigen ligase family protein [Terriglobia bacterium]